MQSVRRATLAFLMVLCAFAGCYQARFGMAKLLLTRPEEGAAAAAARLAPEDSDPPRLLADRDKDHQQEHLQRAVFLNGADASAFLQLGLLEESQGRNKEAEADMLRAEQADARPATTWVLANFYARQNDAGNFARWGRRYLAFHPSDTLAFFRLAWRMELNIQRIDASFGPLTCAQRAQLAQVVFVEGDLAQALMEEQQAARCASGADLRDPELLTSRLLAQDLPGDAKALWDELAANPHFRSGPGEGNLLSNPAFAETLSEEGFDWHLNRGPGVTSTQLFSQRALVFVFNGEQPEHTTILYQPVVLVAGRTYHLRADLQAEDSGDADAFHWRLVELTTGKTVPTALTDEPTISTEGERSWTFKGPASSRTLVLALACDRLAGESSFNGAMTLSQVALTESAASR